MPGSFHISFVLNFARVTAHLNLVAANRKWNFVRALSSWDAITLRSTTGLHFALVQFPLVCYTTKGMPVFLELFFPALFSITGDRDQTLIS